MNDRCLLLAHRVISLPCEFWSLSRHGGLWTPNAGKKPNQRIFTNRLAAIIESMGLSLTVTVMSQVLHPTVRGGDSLDLDGSAVREVT
jgi:hypothetical protein